MSFLIEEWTMRVESSIYEIKGKELILRNPEESDAERLLSYLKTTSRETPYLIREPEEITLTLLTGEFQSEPEEGCGGLRPFLPKHLFLLADYRRLFYN